MGNDSETIRLKKIVLIHYFWAFFANSRSLTIVSLILIQTIFQICIIETRLKTNAVN